MKNKLNNLNYNNLNYNNLNYNNLIKPTNYYYSQKKNFKIKSFLLPNINNSLLILFNSNILFSNYYNFYKFFLNKISNIILLNKLTLLKNIFKPFSKNYFSNISIK